MARTSIDVGKRFEMGRARLRSGADWTTSHEGFEGAEKYTKYI
jgi:hypothetical protein